MTALWIDQPDTLRAHLANPPDRVGLDTEFVRERTWWPVLALVQIALDDGVLLVDPTVAGMPEAIAELLRDTRVICEAAIRLWHPEGAPPHDRYVFMLNAVHDAYGGLEHRASTALICKRADLPRIGAPDSAAAVGEGYVTLLGLISHEYFHTWNVKR